MQLMAMMYEEKRPIEERAMKAPKAAVLAMLRQERTMTITMGSQTARTGTECFRSICMKTLVRCSALKIVLPGEVRK